MSVQEFHTTIDGRPGVVECDVDEEIVPLAFTWDADDDFPQRTIDRHDFEWRAYVGRIDMRRIEEIIQDREMNGSF